MSHAAEQTDLIGLIPMDRLIRRAYERSIARTQEHQEAIGRWHCAEEQALARRQQDAANGGQ